jgi:hypothetical protein
MDAELSRTRLALSSVEEAVLALTSRWAQTKKPPSWKRKRAGSTDGPRPFFWYLSVGVEDVATYQVAGLFHGLGDS